MILIKNVHNTGIAYGVGVGPGDPELLTLKACRLIRENEVIAFPGKDAESSVAYRIAVQAVPELAQKTLVPLEMPMVKEQKQLRESHAHAAKLLASYLEQGQNVIYLILGDVTLYSSFTYLQPILAASGYESRLVSGITSFSAAAARLNVPLAEGDESLHIVPALHEEKDLPKLSGNIVWMKPAEDAGRFRELLAGSCRHVWAVARCGMEDEQVFHCVEELPDKFGYFTIILAKEQHDKNK